MIRIVMINVLQILNWIFLVLPNVEIRDHAKNAATHKRENWLLKEQILQK